MINLWLILRDDAKQAINTCLKTPEDEYSGPVNTQTRRIFERMSDLDTVQKLFKSPDISGNIYHLYSLYIDNGSAQQAADAIDYLTTEYPNHIIVGGAWQWNGNQIAGYEPHPQLIQLMPDVWDGNAFVAATVVTDVNVLAGQSPRDFS